MGKYHMEMLPTPTGRWISRDDPMWERVWLVAPYYNDFLDDMDRSNKDWCQELVSGKTLLALEDAFLAWGEMR
jgi:hypothetical protein